MKKILKRSLSIVLAITMLSTMVIASTLNASAETPSYITIDACDDLYCWQLQSHGELSIDTSDKKEGTGSIFLDLPEEGVVNPVPFAGMIFLTFEDYIDINNVPYFDMMWESSVNTRKSGIQINFVDSDVAGADGINCNYAVDDKEPEWQRCSIDVLSQPKTISGVSYDHITSIRISWLSYWNNCEYYENDWHFDNLVFMSKKLYDDRATEETRVRDDVIAPLEVPTAETIDSLETAILSAKQVIEEDKEIYPNFFPENIKKYERVIAAYNELKKADYEQAAVTAIGQLATITADNYKTEKANVEAARALIDDLDDKYGEGNYNVSNIGNLEEAEKAIADFTALDEVKDAVDALPDVESVTIEDKEAVENADNLVQALSDEAKELLDKSYTEKIQALKDQIWNLENPYTLGDLDGEEGVSASDALVALQGAVKKIQLTDLQKLAADVDGSETVDATDALLILQKAVSKISLFPIEADK